MSDKMILVCRTHGKPCKEEGFRVKVKDTEHIFCCEDGFKKTLETFSEKMAKEQQDRSTSHNS